MKKENAHYIAVTGIVVKDGKFLLTKRSSGEKAFPNMWTVPGGKLHLNDYISKPKDTSDAWYNVLEDLLRREVKEETGLDIKNIRYLTSLSFIRPDGVPVVVLSLYADHASGDVIKTEEAVDHAWVTLEEAKSYDLIDGIYDELVMLYRVLKGKQQPGEWKKTE
ncbi:MAG: NUDIX domain-containing protein [archaeon]|nr:MAG: NUDIX domain-containing protein [archaeon]